MFLENYGEISPENAMAVFSKSLDGIICYKILKNEEGRVNDFMFISLNHSAEVILKASKEKFIGNRFLALFPGSVESGLFDAFVSAAESQSIKEIEFSYKDENYEGWYKDTIIPFDEDKLLVFFKNITEEKRIQSELAHRTEQLEQAKKELTDSLKEKEMLLKEIHHRVKNNLQIISSIVNLQSSYLNDHHTLGVFRETQSRINAIALLHQKIYESRLLSSIDFSIYLKDITTSIFNTFNANAEKVELEFDIQNIDVDIDYGIYLGLVLNELITNALKHAFPDERKGKIFISVKQKEKIEIVVQDDGIGFPANYDITESDSLGMQIISSMIEQMDGEIIIEKNPGTKFKILLDRT